MVLAALTYFGFQFPSVAVFVQADLAAEECAKTFRQSERSQNRLVKG